MKFPAAITLALCCAVLTAHEAACQALTPSYTASLPSAVPEQSAPLGPGGLWRAVAGRLAEERAAPVSAAGIDEHRFAMMDLGGIMAAAVFEPDSCLGASGNGVIRVFAKEGQKDTWRCLAELYGNAVHVEPSPSGRTNLISHWHLGFNHGIITRHVYDQRKGRYLPTESVEYEEPAPQNKP